MTIALALLLMLLPGAALAEPISALLVGSLLPTAAVGSAVGFGFLAKLGGSLLLSAASRALQKKPKSAIQGRTITGRAAVDPRDFVYGRRGRKAGTIVYMETRANGSSINDQVLDIVIVFTGHPVQAIGAIWLDGVVAIDAAGVPQGRFANNISVEKHLGGTTPPFPFLRSVSGGKWTTAHRLEGCAAIAISLNSNPEVYPSGIPNITADIVGKNDILDPRIGQRIYTENAALCLADYMSLPRYGLGAQIGAVDGINEAELIASANVCDEPVLKVGGGTEARYTCNGVLSLAESPQANIEAMLTAMAGSVVYAGGQWFIQAGYYRTPTVTLTATDVREQGLSLATRQSRSENFNAVRGTFISPDNDWQPDDFPAYESAVYLVEDNGERTYRDLSLPFTIFASTAQRLAKIELERQRRQQTVEFAGKLTAWRVGTGDVVSLTYDRWGFAAKPFDVVNLKLSIEQQDGGPAILPTLTLRETSPLVYDWTASEEKIYAAAPRTALPNAFDIEPPGPPTVTESLYQTVDSSGVKVRVLLRSSVSPSAFVAQYQFEARRVGTIEWLLQGRSDRPEIELLDWPPGEWSFRAKAILVIGVSSDYVQTDAEIIGLGAAPVALSGVVLQSMGGLAVIEWELHPDLDVQIGGHIVIRHSAAGVPNWATSVSMKTVPGSTALAVLPLKPGAYILRAEDASGNLGPETVVSTTGIQAIPFGPLTTLQEDATFTGTRSGVVLDTGTLRLDTTGNVDAEANFDAIANLDTLGGVLASGTYTFAAGMNFGSVKRCRLRSVIDLVTVGILDNVDTRPGSVDTWLSFDGSDGGESDCVVEFRTTQTNPSGSPVWSGWSRVDNAETQAWGVQARAILTTSDAGFTPAISQLRLIAEEAI